MEQPKLELRSVPVTPYPRHRLCAEYGTSRVETLDARLGAVSGGDPGRGLEVWHVNSGNAGGVADAIRSWLAHTGALRSVRMRWFIYDVGSVAEITKKMHNIFIGRSEGEGGRFRLTDGDRAAFLEATRLNAQSLLRQVASRAVPPPDVVFIHDPQPSALFWMLARDPEFSDAYRRYFSRTAVLWFAHIPFADIQSTPESREAWAFVREFISGYDARIFQENVERPQDIPGPILFNRNAVDPQSLLNVGLPRRFVEETFAALRLPVDRPWVLQNGRFDPWKDPEGVCLAYRQAVIDWMRAPASVRQREAPPRLLLAGPISHDDPETFATLRALRATVSRVERELQALDPRLDRNIHLRPLFPDAPPGGDHVRAFREVGVDPDLTLPRLTLAQADALAGSAVDPRGLTAVDAHCLTVNALQTGAAIIVVKSLAEGFGLAATGAKLHGKPLICANTGGLGPQVEHGVTGFKVGLHGRGPGERIEPSEVLAPARELIGSGPLTHRDLTVIETGCYLLELISKPELRERVGRAAQQDVREKYLTLDQLERMAGWIATVRSGPRAD